MSAQESSITEKSSQYLSKRVKINGQFVTLYSLNGVTWLSSPEDIPDTMARLENTRITLSDPEAEGEEKASKKDAKGDAKGAKEQEKTPPQPPKAPNSQYRMKGPKPRPILRQGGKVVEGTPIDPVSGSAVNVKASVEISLPSVKISPLETGLRRGKIIAPIAERRPLKAKALAEQKAKAERRAQQEALAKAKAALKSKQPVVAKGLRGSEKVPAQTKSAPNASAKVGLSKGQPAKKAPPIKAAVKKALPLKKVAKPMKATKKPVANKPSAPKGGAKKATPRSGAKKGKSKR